MLSLGVVTFSLNGYASNIAQDVAIEAAHLAALADIEISEAQLEAERTLGAALGGVFNSSVVIEKVQTSNGCRAKASVSITTVVFGLLGKSVPIDRQASAICELQE